LVSRGWERSLTNYILIYKGEICIIPGAEYGSSKCWPVSHFARLADMIVSEYKMKVYILPGLKEEGIAKAIFETVSRKESVEIRSMAIRDLKVCLSKAEAVISNDTGPRHIAAALSVPTIVFLGPMDERYTSYNSPNTHQVVRDVPCRPCNKRRCDKGMSV
jgi:heptosyltransferase-2